jgi:hypothetical protein
MSDETNEVDEGQEVAAKTKVAKKKVAPKDAAKKAPVKKAAVKGKPVKSKDAKKATKPAKAKADRGPRVTQEGKNALVLKFLAKQTKPVTRNQISAGTGLPDGINKTCNVELGPNLVKREAGKFHDMGKGFVFSITANGRKAATKL